MGEVKVEGKRKFGRYKRHWFNNIQEWTGYNYVQAIQTYAAQNRTAWRMCTNDDEVASCQKSWRQQGRQAGRQADIVRMNCGTVCLPVLKPRTYVFLYDCLSLHFISILIFLILFNKNQVLMHLIQFYSCCISHS